MMTTTEFAAEAMKWLDVPYHHQGRSWLGVDCIGLPLAILKDAGELPPHVRPRMDYGRRPMVELMEQFNKYCTKIDEPIVGSVVTIHWASNPQPGHVAIVVPPVSERDPTLHIVHAHMRVKKVVLNSYTSHWRLRTTDAWLMPGVAVG